jgi:hypothetical protein
MSDEQKKIRRAAPEPPDRRISPRERVSVRAELLLEGRGVVDCVIRDRSTGGLRLLFRHEIELPPTFKVLDRVSGKARGVKMVWTSVREVGVAFTD